MTESNKSFASFDSVKIAYTEIGRGEITLVFIHGWCCNREFFRPQIEHFNTDYHILAPDLPGHGKSGHDRKEWSIDHYARDVAALVESRAGSSTVLIGHSMAGAVVLEAVKLCGGKVKSVVLVDTHAFDYGHLDEERIRGFLDSMRADLQGFIGNLVANTLPEQKPEGLEDWIRQQMISSRLEVAMPSFDSLLRWDAMPTLQRLDIPVISIHGSLINKTAMERYRNKMRGYEMAGAGHFLQLEDPVAFNRILQRAFSENL